MTIARKIALTFLIVALVCPWLAYYMHSMALQAVGTPAPASLNLREYANTLSKSYSGKSIRARGNAIRACLNWEDALWVFTAILTGAGIVLFVRNLPIKIFEPRQYPVEIAGCNGVTLSEPTWRSSFAVLINGKRAPAGSEKRSFRIPREDGGEVRVRLITWPPFDVPRLEVGNETMRVVPALHGLQWAIILLPLVLVLIGGALGGALAAVGAAINTRIMRSDLPKTERVLLLASAAAILSISYLIGFLLVMMLFRK